jgi:tyrosinase
MAAVMPNVQANPQSNGLGYNPRCLRRDVSKYSAAYTTVNYTYSLITGNSDISDFQNTMQGVQTQSVGVHSGGHFTIGGDPGGVSFPPWPIPAC